MNNLDEAFAIGRKHLSNGAEMESSARLCFEDAIAQREDGNLYTAARRLLKSVEYSIGVFHPDYFRVRQLTKGYRNPVLSAVETRTVR